VKRHGWGGSVVVVLVGATPTGPRFAGAHTNCAPWRRPSARRTDPPSRRARQPHHHLARISEYRAPSPNRNSVPNPPT